MKNEILAISRQDQTTPLSGWFNEKLEHYIKQRKFLSEQDIQRIKIGIVGDLAAYASQSGINNVVLGISGGIDSAVTAALFKEAAWNVTGMLLPINQNPEETQRGVEVCDSLGIRYKTIDLSEQANSLSGQLVHPIPTTKEDKIRSGNIRARLRMITLYNEASKLQGLVASTDNFSELTAGFWTLHGDVGDLSPIQSLWKSWEVPTLARLLKLPESVVTAVPTDGLGVDNGDEAQFGCTYLEWDIMVMAFLAADTNINDDRSREVYDIVADRMKRYAYKRYNPAYLNNRMDPYRFSELASLDLTWTPEVLK